MEAEAPKMFRNLVEKNNFKPEDKGSSHVQYDNVNMSLQKMKIIDNQPKKTFVDKNFELENIYARTMPNVKIYEADNREI